ncbi:hypothetical protein GY45DRAFT_1346230 [Cubamyces sp. BRFM 1775]|nr:hypothetical protein GY45DRAFT_1346230 [Cubamyces sp. BRFM 1775]
MVAPWDIYAKQLFDQGYGHPLWAPEPSHHFGEVRIGDVGYISEGRFIFLFRSTLPQGDSTFEIPTASIHVPPNEIAQDLLTSQSMHSVSASGQAGISGNVAEACLRYKCTQQAGALLLLKDSGHATRLTCHDKIRAYMHAHLSRWYTFATEELGIDVDESEIIFVSGYVKTTVWGEIAFHSRTTDGELVLSGGFVGPPTVGGSGSLAVSLSRCEKPVVFYRTGSYSQCLFLNYHVMKTRLFRSKVMRAAAGPHQLPPSEDPDPDMSISQCPASNTPASKCPVCQTKTRVVSVPLYAIGMNVMITGCQPT